MRTINSDLSLRFIGMTLIMGIQVLAEQRPQSVVTQSRTPGLFKSINAQIDQRIQGQSSINGLPLFTDFYKNAVIGVFSQNTNCWAADLDLSSCSVWTSLGKSHPTGTLITPSHILSATHYPVLPGTALTFISKKGDKLIRKVVAVKQLPIQRGDYPDLMVGLLDEVISPDFITPACILPSDYKQVLGNGECLPCIWLSQHKEAKLGDVALLDGSSVVTFQPKDKDRKRFYKRIEYYDSGNPVYMIIQGQTVVLTVWTRGSDHGVGTSIADFATDLNRLIEELSPCGGFRLRCVDLKE